MEKVGALHFPQLSGRYPQLSATFPHLSTLFPQKATYLYLTLLYVTQYNVSHMKKKSKEDLFDNLSLEMRRGALVLAVLSRLRQPQYGYSLKQALGDQGLEINEGTLYPLLRRLEKQGLLSSEWLVIDDKRPRRYYRLSPLGETLLATLTQEWAVLADVMANLLALSTGGSK